jgi:hypothetical protein
MEPFKRDLTTGSSRSDVERYFHSRNLIYNATSYSRDTGTDQIEIGEEPPGNLWCEPWRVYIAFEFGFL